MQKCPRASLASYCTNFLHHTHGQGSQKQCHWRSILYPISMFFRTTEATAGVPGPVLGSPVQVGHQLTGVSAVKGHQDDEGIGVAVV